MLDLPSVIKIITRSLLVRAIGATYFLAICKARVEAVAPFVYFTALMALMAFFTVFTLKSPKLNSSLAWVPKVTSAIRVLLSLEIM